MLFSRLESGLTLRLHSPPVLSAVVEDAFTQEAAVQPPSGQVLRVTPLVEEGAVVAQGAPVACVRDAPDLCLVAPMPGRVARLKLMPGRKLSEIVLYREAGGDVVTHDVSGAATQDGLRRLVQRAGAWVRFRRRPFGGMPDVAERPAAIVVMAVDTRPFAPDPRLALTNQEEAFTRGLGALAALTDGPIFVCRQKGPPLAALGTADSQVQQIVCGSRHPQGSAGILIHDLAPAAIDAPVWDIHAEDVAALGTFLDTGILPMTRHVSVAGGALREGRLVRTQPGADLRELTQSVLLPGANVVLSGSPLDGQAAHWLAPRHRQVTSLPRDDRAAPPHWLRSAVMRSARPIPIIPTAALTNAFGAALPAAVFVRALSAGDDELAMRLGVLSFLEEDIALADYVLGGAANLRGLLRGMLDRIRAERAA